MLYVYIIQNQLTEVITYLISFQSTGTCYVFTLLCMYSKEEAYSQISCFSTPLNKVEESSCWFGSGCGSAGFQCDPQDLSPQLNGPGSFYATGSVCWVCKARVGLLRLLTSDIP